MGLRWYYGLPIYGIIVAGLVPSIGTGIKLLVSPLSHSHPAFLPRPAASSTLTSSSATTLDPRSYQPHSIPLPTHSMGLFEVRHRNDDRLGIIIRFDRRFTERVNGVDDQVSMAFHGHRGFKAGRGVG